MFFEHFRQALQFVVGVDGTGGVAGEENMNSLVLGVMAASSCCGVIL